MASRRIRIKGIANIPQRRKVEINNSSEQAAVPLVEDNTSNESEAAHIETALKIIENGENTDTETQNTEIVANTETGAENTEDASHLVEISANTETGTQNAEAEERIAKREIPARPVVIKRRFIKSVISANCIRKPRPKLEEVKCAGLSDEPAESACVSECSEPNLEETTLSCSQSEAGVKLAPNQQSESGISGSDSEYPAAPPSPSKLINRSRIKAVPRFSQRRTSVSMQGSASESEDDNKKNFSRIRNDSVCSAVSGAPERQIANGGASPQRNREFSSVIQRKCRRTEQSRKMAEARREFQQKFGNRTPDRQKLTMLDLIFYNPSTNPMSQKPKKEKQIEEIVTSDVETKTTEKDDVEEIEQDPPGAQSDEENAVPVPQIKIGANGEIIIDEQSLVIQNKETEKGLDDLKNSSLIDGDFDTGYGVYKRFKRSKDWSKSETLRFYKALNTIGTDFTLMCELFPKRTRRELKMKFKKEERVNHTLIDRALMHPGQFDLTELRRDMEMEQREQLQMERVKAQKEENAKNRVRRGRIKGGLIAREIDDASAQSRQPKRYKKPRKCYEYLEKGIDSILEEEDEDDYYPQKGIESILEEEMNEFSDEGQIKLECDEPKSESDSDISDKEDRIPTPKPTRSGRVPKPRRRSYSLEIPAHKRKKTDPVEMPGGVPVEPGSIMIVSTQTPAGQPVYNVFMVTPGQINTPITLTPEILENLTKSVVQQHTESNVQQSPPSLENNVTIPADDTCYGSEEHNFILPDEPTAMPPKKDNFQHENVSEYL